MKVLGIETSCDETGVAIFDLKQGLMAHALYSQIELHSEYGGVVPELASRDHLRKILPLIQQVIVDSGCSASDLQGIACTVGPGLVGALLVGSATAQSLAWAWDIPIVGVHHMEGHLLAPMLEPSRPEFPFVALLVSGGHTMLVRVDGVGDYTLLGETLDDAAGEAFDKTAKMLGLGYPGGPALAKLAEHGSSTRFRFPRPMTNRPGLDFSFSGLKTFAINTWQDVSDDETAKADIARAFQDAVVDTMAIKCRRAIEATGLQQLVVAGGVGANQALRSRLSELPVRVYYPRPDFCTDNGAMIAYAGCLRLHAGQADPLTIQARARWSLESLNRP